MQESTARQARLLKVMQTLADYVRSDAALDALLAASLEISGGVAAGIFAAGQRYLAGDWNRISAESENWILELAENADGSLLLNRDEDDFAPLSAGLSDAVDFVVVIPLRSGGGRHVAGAFVLGFEANAPDEAIRADLYLLAGQVALVLVSMEFDWLQRRYQRLGSMMANIPEPILLLDRDNTVCELNPAAVEVFRIEEQDIIGRQIQEVLNDEIDLLRYLDTLPRKTSPRDFITVRDRSFRPQVSEVAVKSGELPWRLLVLMDVSHYQRLNDNMMMFLQTVSHDLRSPLTAAKGFIDMMPMVGELNDKQMMMQDKVLTSIIDMTNLVEKVLDAGRLDPEMGGYQLRRDLCDPGKIVEKVVSTLTNAANKKDLYLKAEVASGVPVMNLDELMIERALMNLVENAIKYTPEGGEIVVQAVVEQNHLFLDVIDNGFGIPEDKQDSLFERGSRIRRTEHKAIRGSGLGLFIVKNVAQQHGGDAIIESEEGSGSRFRIRVPISGLNAPGGASE